jgi:hypothetical protein
MESISKNTVRAVFDWTATQDESRPAALHVVLHKREYVFPWSRFIYAEGSNDEVILSYPTHEILVNGYGLNHLLADIARHSVLSLREPHRADKFRGASEPEPIAAITHVTVQSVRDGE